MEEIIRQRDEARSARNYALADELREYLRGYGFLVEDTKNGTIYHRIVPRTIVFRPIPSGAPVRTPYTPDWMP